MQPRYKKNYGDKTWISARATTIAQSPANHQNLFQTTSHFFQTIQLISLDNQQGDAIWFLLKTLSRALGKMLPTWAAYDSLMGQKKPLTNIVMLPIINGSLAEWQNLYASIKEAEKLRRKIFKDGKTIISFDYCSCTLK